MWGRHFWHKLVVCAAFRMAFELAYAPLGGGGQTAAPGAQEKSDRLRHGGVSIRTTQSSKKPYPGPSHARARVHYP